MQANQFEYKTKDNVRVSGLDPNQLSRDETGKDRVKDIGCQTSNGLSVRAFVTSLCFVKALAYFRGESAVSYEDVRQVIPVVLHDKVVQNSDAPFFEQKNNAVFRSDRISWIRNLFDASCAEYDRRGLDQNDPVGDLMRTF